MSSGDRESRPMRKPLFRDCNYCLILNSITFIHINTVHDIKKSIYLNLIYGLLFGKTVCFKNIVEYKARSTFYIILLQYEVEY